MRRLAPCPGSQPIEGIHVQQPLAEWALFPGRPKIPYPPKLSPTTLRSAGWLILPGTRYNRTGQQNQQPGKAVNDSHRGPKMAGLQAVLLVCAQIERVGGTGEEQLRNDWTSGEVCH